MKIVVHGGAGLVEKSREAACEAGCAAAVRAGLAVLVGGGSAVDAVIAAVRVLEDDPEFNAGVGCALTRDGTPELDAAVMDGATLGYGAVGAVPCLRRPVDLAHAVMQDGEHALLVGDAAWAFGREKGFAPVAAEEMITARARERLARALARGRAKDEGPRGTVGACAIDGAGHLAAATSTGGIMGKRPGRVGDSPLPGCGTFADDLGGAASATGHGEAILRVTLTRQIVDRLRGGMGADEAARAALADLAARTGAEAGVIVVDRQGGVAAPHLSPDMPHAWGTAEGVVSRVR
jgi:beta-aspartyl-peptidase (threonine type)